MRIIYLHQYFKKPNENGGTRSYDLASSFVKLGHTVEMVTTTSRSPENKRNKWSIESVDGITVHYLYLPYDNSYSFLKRAWVFIQFIYFSTSKLLKIKGDVLLATSTPLTISIPDIIKKIFHRTPYIFEVRDIWPEAVSAIGAINSKLILKLLSKLEFYSYKLSDWIVPLSVDMRKSIVERYPEFESKIKHVIENIAEVNRFGQPVLDNYKLEKSLDKIIGFTPKISVLYAGTFGRVNNIEYVIRLASKVYEKDTSIIFLLLGDGSEKDHLIGLAKSLGIYKKNLFFLAPVSKRELPLIYSQVTVGSSFVASIKELWANSANKFFDTLAAGCPIIINHYGWQAQKIIENEIGYVLNPNLEEVNLEEFIKYLKNRQFLLESGIRSRKVATENYSLDEAVRKYNEILSSVS
ncbi:glycosyltransferase family 4 protein [Pseudopedobacter sp.]|uniref:glycosyltransferase family 4 protein n=1 Tax=Pseudopedobacter sp. TaxID=1936787 RepID=UPI00333F3DA1